MTSKYVLADFNDGGTLFTHLRHRLKRYKKRLHKQRGRILGKARELDTDVYFADPCAFYQRGAHENANGFLRQYIPKGTDLRTVTQALVAKVQVTLNLLPTLTLVLKHVSFGLPSNG